MLRHISKFLSLFIIFLLVGCSPNENIVNNVEEREANEIVVYLASKGIPAQKIQIAAETGAANTAVQFNIAVAADQTTAAMAYLNRIGLPRVQGTDLLTLFAKSGLMSSDREETIRYQAGLAQQLKNTILKIDGIVDADVQISYPAAELTATPGAIIPKTTASVYIKHQGILEDPNSHLETKIKRLVSASINGLAFEDVTVISDRARLADIQLTSSSELIGSKNLQDAYVSIWSIVMTKSSLGKFRFIFFTLILLNLLFASGLGYMAYRFYPQLMKKKDDVPPLTPDI